MLIRDLGRDEFLDYQHNVVLVGGQVTGKIYLATDIGWSCIQAGETWPIIVIVTDRLPQHLGGLNFVFLDVLGYLRFTQSSAQILFQYDPPPYGVLTLTTKAALDTFEKIRD